MKKNFDDKEKQMLESVVNVNRVATTTKGGRFQSFSVLTVVGDQNGRAGYGKGNAKEAPDAKRKAIQSANKNTIKIPLYKKHTIPHDVYGKYGASKVLLLRAKPGTGVIAGEAMRITCEVVGIKDIVVKSLGSNNPNNIIRAIFNAFSNLSSGRAIAERRGKTISEMLGSNKA